MKKNLKKGKLEEIIFQLSKSSSKINFYIDSIKKNSMQNSSNLIIQHIMDVINAR